MTPDQKASLKSGSKLISTYDILRLSIQSGTSGTIRKNESNLRCT